MNKEELKLKMLKIKFSVSERLGLYEKIASFLHESYPVNESLLEIQAVLKKRKNYKSDIIDYWLEEMNKGKRFSDAIKEWIPYSETNLIAAGEESGNLENGLKEAIKFTTLTREITGTIRKTMVYPVILLLMALLLLAIFYYQLVPTYSEMLPTDEWTGTAATMFTLTSAIFKTWYIVFPVLIGIGYVCFKSLPVLKGEFREKFLDKIPPYSIYKLFNTSIVLVTLSSLLDSGIPIYESIEKMRKNSSPWLADYLAKMLENLNTGGNNFGEHLDVGLFPEDLADDLISFSKLGSFDKAIKSLGNSYISKIMADVELKMKMVTTGAFIIVVSLILMFYSSGYDVQNGITDKMSSSTLAD